jgi:hypothetical protein
MSRFSSIAERWLRRGLQATVVLSMAAAAISPLDGHAQDKVLNLYSARHYQTDNALYDNFTKQTGIKINRIELGDEALVQRLKTEGANSPADAVLLVEQPGSGAPNTACSAGRVKVLVERIPVNCARTTAPGTADPRTRDRLRQVARQGGRRRHLRETGRSQAHGPGLHSLGFTSVHAVADRRDDRAQRRGQDRRMGQRHGRQYGASAARWRYRSDQGRRVG